MDLEQKLDILAGAANTEVVGMTGRRAGGVSPLVRQASNINPLRPRRRGFKDRWVYHATGYGRPVRLMSLLMTNACSFTCRYCATRRDRNIVRSAVTPEELASTFIALIKADMADGLFLTSGIPGRPQTMMDRMLAAADLIRNKHGFKGYVHLKILPGADDEQIAQACRLASRVSINLEAPREDTLKNIAPEKSLQSQILPALERIGKLREGQGRQVLPAGVTSQLIAGVSDNSDQELLQVSTRLLRKGQLTKTHFSAFEPVADTPLENRPPASFTREHRLYQADYLLRQYGFELEDLTFDPQGNLVLAKDPKWVWARSHPEFFPVEAQRADREMILRVPGIGPRSADRLLAVRRRQTLRSLDDLARLGVVVRRARGFITLNGRQFAPLETYRQDDLSYEEEDIAPYPLPCANGVSPCAYR